MTSDTMKVDWDQPLEAVHQDGRVVAIDSARNNGVEWDKQPVLVKPSPDRHHAWFRRDGTHPSGEWTIRNKPAAAVDPAPVEEWGPAIEVGGVRPAWLGDDELVNPCWSDGVWYDDASRASLVCGWGSVTKIKLPANHTHYRTENPATGPNGILTGTERLERLEALTARLAAIKVRSFHDDDLVGLVHEARGLVVDPVEALADKLYSEWLDNSEDTRWAIVAGIKAGRESSPASDHRSK